MDQQQTNQSTRELQKNTPERVNTAGKPMPRPRLAQNRVAQRQNPVKKAVKSKLTKWAVGLIGGSAAAAGGVTIWSLFS